LLYTIKIYNSLRVDSNIAKNFDIIAIRVPYIIILMVWTKLFSDLYFSKIVLSM